MVSLFYKIHPLGSLRCEIHELVQDQELQFQFQDVAESLDGMADARLVAIYQDDGQDVQAESDDDDIDEVGHDAALSDARLEVQDLSERPNVDAAEDNFGNCKADLGASIGYGLPG